jgi:hypothetical protein
MQFFLDHCITTGHRIGRQRQRRYIPQPRVASNASAPWATNSPSALDAEGVESPNSADVDPTPSA